MGNSRFSASDYHSYASSTAHKTVHDYATTGMRPEFDPKKVIIRESVKSALNPKPTPVIVALDVSGSMGVCVEACRKGLGTIFEQIISRAVVSDPHVMAMAVDDVDADPIPLQVTQFEADPVTIGKQIEQLTIVGNGGGNGHETYLGPLYFALEKTKCDAFKDGRKGYLFTVGDEQPQFSFSRKQIETMFGGENRLDYTAEQLIAAVERDWNYFHIMVEEGSHFKHYADVVRKEWASLLGERAIRLKDHTKLAEVVVSIIQVNEGTKADDVVKSWSGGTELIVQHAIAGLPVGVGSAGAGPVTL